MCKTTLDPVEFGMPLDRREKFFLQDEVVMHNQIDSAWVVIRGNVFDITALYGGGGGTGSRPSSPKKVRGSASTADDKWSP